MPGSDLPRERSSGDSQCKDSVTRSVGVSRVGDDVLGLAGLGRVDYVDRFTVALPYETCTSPEQWARAMFGDVPNATERLIWQGLLQFRLASGRSPSTIAGWSISGRDEDWIRLQTASRLLTGTLVIQTTTTALSLMTFLQYDRVVGAVQWLALSAIHRQMVPGLLRSTVSKVTTTKRENR